MHAYWYEKAGPAADVLECGTMPDPVSRRGEVLVKVTHSAINPTDAKRRTSGRELTQFQRIIPNNDGAGIIEAIGDDVPSTRVGERVWIFGAQADRPCGTAAEYILLPSRQAIALPERASLSDGACLGVPAVTAHRGLFSDGSITGQTVLVTGAAGRVGSYAVQLAKWAGARVIGTAGSDEKVKAVDALGADLALRYDGDDVAAAIRDFAGDDGIDRVVDTAFSETIALAAAVLRPNGVIASYSSDACWTPQIPFQTLMRKNIVMRPFGIFAMPREAQDRAFADINAALRAGVLRHRIGRTVPFGDMVAAHAQMEGKGVWGCFVVEVDGRT